MTLTSICKTTACNIKINVLDPSHQISQVIQLNPVVTPLYEVNYNDLLPGNYTMAVDATSLPIGASQDYLPNSGVISVASAENRIGQINFNYATPQKEATLMLHMTPLQDKFPAITQINAILVDTTTGKINNISLPLNGANITINNLVIGHSYQITSDGLANAYDGIYYQGLKQTNVINNITNDVTLSLSENKASKHAVKFAVAGVDAHNTSILFASNAKLDKGIYVYTQNPLVNEHSYMFLDNEVATVNMINISSGYTVNVTPNTISSSTTDVKVAFNKIVTTGSYDYIAPFKDYNHKITLSVHDIASAKSLEFTSNFKPATGWGDCFGQSVANLSFNTISLNDKFITTVTSKDSKLSLNFAKTCDIMGTDSGSSVVFTGVEVPQVYAVKLDSSTKGATLK